MSAQTVPVNPAGFASGIVTVSASKAFNQRQEYGGFAINLVQDVIALRNAVDALNTLFLAHTHKVPAGALAAQSSGPDNTTAAGGAATAPTANAAPANTVTTV